MLNPFQKKNTGFIIFIAGLFFYLFIALFINKQYIGSDGRSFQRMAVNISEGNGYSDDIDPPFEKQFFREPGFPYFFSGACVLNKLFGKENIALSYNNPKPGYFDKTHTEIFILRILHALLASLTVWLFYKILLFFLKPQLALLISFLFIFYLPFSIFVTFPQREILVTALLTGMGYLFLQSASTDKSFWFDIIFGLLSAVLVLTLQAYIFILPVFLISHILITKSIKKTFKSVSIISIVFILGVAPWSYRGYKEAKDLRAIKTFGISYTYEFRKFHEANAKAYFANLNGNGDLYRQKIIEGYSESGKQMFEKSFNGYYLHYADSLNKVIGLNAFSSKSNQANFFLKNILFKNFRKALIWPFWKQDYRKNISSLLKNNNQILMAISLFLGIVIAIFALLGMVKYIFKIWFYIPVFTFHFLMIPFMSDEGRRMLPFIPFYYMFFILGLVFFYHLIRKRFFNQRDLEMFKPLILKKS
ncbi:MAG TPA: hypothetical protein DCG75_17495 [Bacteroidales bacterium]|nr:hypothetical protein [Bacteroidales bacterium]